MSLLSNIGLARACLENWIGAAWFMRRAFHEDESAGRTTLRFRDGVELDNVTNASLAYTLVIYYHYARMLGVYSRDDMLTLRSIGEDINKKLRGQFSETEIGKCSTGGRFSPKEAMLFALVRKYKPSHVIETGVAQGVSSYVILKSLQENSKGTLLSIDLPNRDPSGYKYANGTSDPTYIPEELMPGWLVPDDLRSLWDLKLGKSSDILPTVNTPVDFFFHDSEHSYKTMTFEFEWAYSHLSSGGLLTADDVAWNEAFNDFLMKHSDMSRLLKEAPLGIAEKK